MREAPSLSIGRSNVAPVEDGDRSGRESAGAAHGASVDVAQRRIAGAIRGPT
jgi:hypothetical protein